MKQKAIVMISGGPDSSTLLFSLAHDYELTPIYFDYGQNASDFEIISSRKICEALNLNLEIIDLSSLKRTFLGLNKKENIALSIRGNCPVALLAIAGIYAAERNIDNLILGIHKEDFPDIKNISNTLEKYSEVLEEFNNKLVKISAPFITKRKKEVLEFAIQLGVPLEETRSCERRDYIHCGECKPCKERKKAFAEMGIEDKVTYKV